MCERHALLPKVTAADHVLVVDILAGHVGHSRQQIQVFGRLVATHVSAGQLKGVLLGVVADEDNGISALMVGITFEQLFDRLSASHGLWVIYRS